jgi:nucleoside-triphosphatase THEP1
MKVELVKYTDHLDLWGRPTKSAKVVSEDIEREKDSYKIDMKKCRRNIAYHSAYYFPVYSVMDSPQPFSGEVKCGMYYVNTENTYPFRGCGWYYEPLVNYGLNEGLISFSNIQLEFIPSNTLNPDHFQKNINTLLQAFECEPALQKVCVNAYIGLMGRTKQIATTSKFSLCPETASEWWCSNDDNIDSDKTVFIRNHILENGELLYEGIESYQIISESTTYPIYAMILQMEAVELHKLETLIISNGGLVLDRNTDAIRYIAKKPLNIDNYYWDTQKQILKYQTEESKPLQIQRMSNFCRKHTIDVSQFTLNWNIAYDYDGTAESKATEIIESNKSCHIDGRAGTGKSYLTNKVIDEIKKRSKKYLAFSPTNKGARIIGGTTIHSVYYKFKHNKKKLLKILKDVEYIIIDEISMMVEAFYQLFIMIKKIYPTIKFIISGDFAQLPPVNDSWSGDYKNSPAMYELCDGNRIQLTKCRRADDSLFKLCKNISSINVSEFKKTENTYLNIAYTHKTRIQVNHTCMDRFIEENKRSYISLEKDGKNPKSQNLKLCVGMPVIAHTTNKKLNVLNSEKFIIKEIDENSIVMKENEREIKIKLKDFHKFFYIGFCITIHASQGDTFDTKYSIYDWNFIFFCDRAKYVAMSRATNVNNIQIIV